MEAQEQEGTLEISHELEKDAFSWGLLKQFVTPIDVYSRGETSTVWRVKSRLFTEGYGRYDVLITRNGESDYSATASRIRAT